MKRRVFQEVRINIYIAIIINGLLIQFINPFHFLCDNESISCMFCGMRTAINLIIAGEINLAYKSNRLIILIIVIAVIMVLDIIHILYFRIKMNMLKNK